MKRFILYFFLFISISTESISQADSRFESLENQIVNSFKPLLFEKITKELLLHNGVFLDFPNIYWDFLNETFIDNWDFDATTKALIGNKIFKSLSHLQFKDLSRTLEVTLIRYAFESLPYYGEQRLDVIDIKLNEQQTLAWLKISMESTSFPDIHLDLLLKRRDDNQWKGVDFRFKGITYVDMKKNSYRKDFEDLKFQGLLKKLADKNKTFFRDLCQSEANYIDPKKPPCLHNYD